MRPHHYRSPEDKKRLKELREKREAAHAKALAEGSFCTVDDLPRGAVFYMERGTMPYLLHRLFTRHEDGRYNITNFAVSLHSAAIRVIGARDKVRPDPQVNYARLYANMPLTRFPHLKAHPERFSAKDCLIEEISQLGRHWITGDKLYDVDPDPQSVTRAQELVAALLPETPLPRPTSLPSGEVLLTWCYRNGPLLQFVADARGYQRIGDTYLVYNHAIDLAMFLAEQFSKVGETEGEA